MAGAKRYCTAHRCLELVYQRLTQDGDDLDLVFKDADGYVVVAAKGPDCEPDSCPIPDDINPATNEPWWAMEGSLKYLEIMLAAMLQSGNPRSVSVSQELRSALKAGKVKYVQVQTCVRPNGKDGYFEETIFKLTEGESTPEAR
jgi:hypothetical protein